MVLVVFLVLATLVAFGRVEVGLLERFLDVVVPTWLGAHAVEEGAKAMRDKGLSRADRSE